MNMTMKGKKKVKTHKVRREVLKLARTVISENKEILRELAKY